MLNLSDSLYEYIEKIFSHEQQATIFTSFNLLENFGLKFYEDKYINLLYKEYTISEETKQDTFLLYLAKDILNIIESHNIQINIEQEPTLSELNEICSFLYIIQNLEDYRYSLYILSSMLSNREKLINLISHYSLISKIRLLELLNVVEDDLINNLIDYIEFRQRDIKENIDKKHLKKIKYFFNFIDNIDCLGKKAFDDNINNLELEEVINLLDIDLSEYIDKTILIESNPAQASLDILSLLIISKDSYELPLLKFKQYNYLFTNKLENITLIENILINMLNDFNDYYNAQLESEKLNGN